MNANRLAWISLVLLSECAPSPPPIGAPQTVAAPRTGYVVVSMAPTSDTAYILVDGRPGMPESVLVPGLGEAHVVATVGPHYVTVRRQGYADYTAKVEVRENFVVPVRVSFLGAEVRAAKDSVYGVTVQESTVVRVAHLSPAAVPILYRGQFVVNTPATLWLPVGDVPLQVGDASICLNVPPLARGDTAQLLMQSGAIQALVKMSECGQPLPPGVERLPRVSQSGSEGASAIPDVSLNACSKVRSQSGATLDATVCTTPSGVWVSEVAPGGAADVGGLRRGDFISSVNARAVWSVGDVEGAIALLVSGQTVAMTIVRDGGSVTLAPIRLASAR